MNDSNNVIDDSEQGTNKSMNNDSFSNNITTNNNHYHNSNHHNNGNNKNYNKNHRSNSSDNNNDSGNVHINITKGNSQQQKHYKKLTNRKSFIRNNGYNNYNN